MDKATFSIILSGIAIFLGVVAIYTTRPYNWELDFVGTIITILTFLTTLLIGWNIYSVVDAKGRITRIEERQRKSTQDINEKYNDLSVRSRVSFNESKMFLFFLQGQNAYTDTTDNLFLEKYKSFHSSLYYAVQEETDFMVGGIRIALSCMNNCLNERENRLKKGENVDDVIRDIDGFMAEVEYISTSGNNRFTSSQRSDYLALNKRVQDIINNESSII